MLLLLLEISSIVPSVYPLCMPQLDTRRTQAIHDPCFVYSSIHPSRQIALVRQASQEEGSDTCKNEKGERAEGKEEWETPLTLSLRDFASMYCQGQETLLVVFANKTLGGRDMRWVRGGVWGVVS